MKKFAPIPIDRKSFHSFFLVSLMAFLAKMAIVLKEVVIASRYGRQDELDAFLIAFLLPAFVAGMLGSAMNSSFIPVYIQLKKDQGPGGRSGAAQDLFAGISFLNLVAVAVITALTFFLGGLGLERIASGFGEVKIELTIKLLAILTPYILLTGISGLWSALLNAQERYSFVLLTPMITPFLIALLLLCFSSGGIMVLAYGVLAGALIETIVLGAVLLARGHSLRPRWTGWTAPVREVVRQFLPAAAGSCLMGSVLIVDQAMAAMLAPGSVAALSYGNKAIGFLLALLTTTLVTFLTPYFSKRMIFGQMQGGAGGSEELGRGRGLLWQWLGIAFVFGLLCSLTIHLFSEPLAKLIFYRGAFRLTDLRLVAAVQSQLAWQIPFYICAVILTRYIAAMRWNRILFIVAACNVTANILLNLFLMRRMGVEGIALATSLVHVLSLSLLLFFVYLFSKKRSLSASGRRRIFFLRKITKFLYRYRGWSRVADLVRMSYIHSPLRFQIHDFDGDLSFDCALDEHISSQVFWRGDYSTGQLALLRQVLRPGMVFLDAGANKGEFSVFAAKYVRSGQVLAFEPMEETASALRANIAANGFPQVRVFAKALGKMAGERIIYHADTVDAVSEELNLGTVTLYPRAGLNKPCGKIEVLSLDEFMSDGKTERIDVMKIDIEGGELDMLQGAAETIRRCRPVIFIEVNGITSRAAGYAPGAILRQLEEWGYRCERIGRNGETKLIGEKDLKAFQNLVCFPASGEERGPQRKIAFFIPDLRGGGAEKAVCDLLKELVRQQPGAELDLVMVNASGVYLKDVPEEVRIIDLHGKRTFFALFALVRYLRMNRPSVLVAHLPHANTIALLAKKISGIDIPVVVVEHTILHEHPAFPGKKWWLEWGMKKWYPHAAARVAVSAATARQVERRLGLAVGAIKSIYNPIVDEGLAERSRSPVAHPWLEEVLAATGKNAIPVFLGVGRLEPQKDFAALLEAVARVRKERPVRLIILGEGPLRKELEERARRLGIAQDVDMPGFVENPFAYMSRCDAFVLSSRWEGLSNVLIEAMACGCPVISTDCPEGPREVLQDGTYGVLVPVGDVEALAGAMIGELEGASDKLQEKDRKGRKDERIRRAAFFSAEKAGRAWLSLLDEVAGKGDAGKPIPGKRVVLHVITGLRTGGAERMLCRLLSVLDRRQWEPIVLSLTDGSGPEAWLREQGIEVLCLGMRAGKLPSPAMAIRLIRLVRKIRPDLIHGWMYHGNLAAQFANRLLSPRAPVIWSIHHSIDALAVEKKMTMRMIRLGARLSRLPARIVYASKASAEQHLALGYLSGKAILIPYGIDPELYVPSDDARAAVRAELGLPAAGLVIGSLARYHPMKGHAYFLRAAALLAADIRFVLAGTGVDAENETLRTLIAELGIGDRVQLLGERQDTARLLAALDIFTVSSSHGEALPLVLLEAMSCGIPCVTTDVGDAALLVGDTGRVVAVRNPDALAGAWKELIAEGEEKRRSLGAAARKRIKAHYTLSANAAAYATLYTELCDSTG